MDKKGYYVFLCFFMGIIWIIGLFLSTILIPLADINLYTMAELKAAQIEYALNYRLGENLKTTACFGTFIITYYYIKWLNIAIPYEAESN